MCRGQKLIEAGKSSKQHSPASLPLSLPAKTSPAFFSKKCMSLSSLGREWVVCSILLPSSMFHHSKERKLQAGEKVSTYHKAVMYKACLYVRFHYI